VPKKPDKEPDRELTDREIEERMQRGLERSLRTRGPRHVKPRSPAASFNKDSPQSKKDSDNA
jgi:hypothetical protein